MRKWDVKSSQDMLTLFKFIEYTIVEEKHGKLILCDFRFKQMFCMIITFVVWFHPFGKHFIHEARSFQQINT